MIEPKSNIKSLAQRLNQASGGVGLPAHVAARMHRVVKDADILFLDFELDSNPGATLTFTAVAVTGALLVEVHGVSVPPNNPQKTDETVTVGVRRLIDINQVSLGGRDIGWPDSSLQDGAGSVASATFTFADGTVVQLPLSEHKRKEFDDALPAILAAVKMT